MVAARRLYLFIVSALSLAMLVAGLANTGGTLVEALIGGAAAPGFRETLASAGAMALVGLPIWAIHWTLAQRFAQRDGGERASALRRLYLYLTAAGLMLALGLLAWRVVRQIVELATGSSAGNAPGLGRETWQLACVAVFWAYHLRTAAIDRALVGEDGAAATLRRWYAYGVQAVALVWLLIALRDLLSLSLRNLVTPSIGTAGLASAVASALVACAIWLGHARWTAEGRVGEDDRHATLRAVQGFGVVALTVAGTLWEASRALYYGLARAMGVDAPGGQRGELASILIDPASTILVFGAAWLLLRRSLWQDAADAEAPRQAGVRRLYDHLVALIALAALASGIGGLLWVFFDLTMGRGVAPDATEWRNQTSLFLTLVLVGLPTWAFHWKPAPHEPERRALSRRLYLFGALLGGVVVLLGSAVTVAYRLLILALASERGGPGSEFHQALGAGIAAAAVAGYHWRMLAVDGAQRARAEPVPPTDGAPSASFLIRVDGATEAELRAALASLPSATQYQLSAVPADEGKQPPAP